MAVEPGPATPDLLARAIEQARREPFEETPQGWVELSDSIMRKVRTVVRPGVPLLVHAPDGGVQQDERGSRTFLSARVVLDELRRVLQAEPTHAPDRIDLDIDDSRLRGVEVDLVATYGVPLLPLADRVRTEVLSVLHELLGPDPDLGPASVSVEFVDVVPGDPLEV